MGESRKREQRRKGFVEIHVLYINCLFTDALINHEITSASWYQPRFENSTRTFSLSTRLTIRFLTWITKFIYKSRRGLHFRLNGFMLMFIHLRHRLLHERRFCDVESWLLLLPCVRFSSSISTMWPSAASEISTWFCRCVCLVVRVSSRSAVARPDLVARRRIACT